LINGKLQNVEISLIFLIHLKKVAFSVKDVEWTFVVWVASHSLHFLWLFLFPFENLFVDTEGGARK
jgi:hypothetical protein